MSIVVALDVLLRGQTGSLDKAFSKAGKGIINLKRQADGMSAPLLGVTTGIAGAVTAGLVSLASKTANALTSVVTDALSSMSRLGRTADTVGLTTTALAGLQHGAQMAGASAEEADTFLEHFFRSIAEGSKDASSSAAKAFREMDLDAGELDRGLNIDAVKSFADAISNLGSQGQKIAWLKELGGRAAVGLLPMLRSGAGGIDAMTAAVAKLGPVNRAAVTDAQRVTAAWNGFKATIAGTGRQLAVALADPLTEASRGVADLVNRVTPTIVQWVKDLVAGFKELAVVDFPQMKVFASELATAASRSFDFSQELLDLSGMIGGLGGDISLNSRGWKDWGEIAATTVIGIQEAFGVMQGKLAIWMLQITKGFYTITNAGIKLTNLLSLGGAAIPIIKTSPLNQMIREMKFDERMAGGVEDRMARRLLEFRNKVAEGIGAPKVALADVKAEDAKKAKAGKPGVDAEALATARERLADATDRLRVAESKLADAPLVLAPEARRDLEEGVKVAKREKDEAAGKVAKAEKPVARNPEVEGLEKEATTLRKKWADVTEEIRLMKRELANAEAREDEELANDLALRILGAKKAAEDLEEKAVAATRKAQEARAKLPEPDAEPEKQDTPPQPQGKTAAMDLGSKEAFAVLFGKEDYQKKAFAVANEQLKDNKKAVALLEKLVANLQGVKLARAKL